MYRRLNTYRSFLLFLLITMAGDALAVGQKPLAPAQIAGTTRINAEQLLDLYASEPGLVIIDARITADRRQGFIEESVSLPDIDTNCDTLLSQLSTPVTPVIFLCNGPRCRRSANSARTALECGYRNIYWFRGGIEEWMDKRYPLLR